MDKYIGLYIEGTSGNNDGTPLSFKGEMGSPCNFLFTVPFSSTEGFIESQPKRLAIRCENGFTTVGGAKIVIEGQTLDRFSLAFGDDNGPLEFLPYGDALTITQEVVNSNFTFWIKARVFAQEPVRNDFMSSLKIEAVIGQSS